VNSTNVITKAYDNGSTISYINGTLENGTTAAGGTDPSNDSQVSAAVRRMGEFAGWWVMVATVVVGVWMVG